MPEIDCDFVRMSVRKGGRSHGGIIQDRGGRRDISASSFESCGCGAQGDSARDDVGLAPSRYRETLCPRNKKPAEGYYTFSRFHWDLNQSVPLAGDRPDDVMNVGFAKTPASYATSFRARRKSNPAKPEPNRRAAPGKGTDASCTVPLSVNSNDFPLRKFGSPAMLFSVRLHLSPVKALVKLLKEPIAFPPMFTAKPGESGREGPVSPAESAVRSAVILDPLVFPLGVGFGPLVNRSNW